MLPQILLKWVYSIKKEGSKLFPYRVDAFVGEDGFGLLYNEKMHPSICLKKGLLCNIIICSSFLIRVDPFLEKKIYLDGIVSLERVSIPLKVSHKIDLNPNLTGCLIGPDIKQGFRRDYLQSTINSKKNNNNNKKQQKKTKQQQQTNKQKKKKNQPYLLQMYSRRKKGHFFV